MALKDADAFYKRLSRRMEQRYMADKSDVQKECDRLLSRNQEIDDIILNLYTAQKFCEFIEMCAAL